MASQLRIAGDAQKHRARKAEFEREAAREQRDTTEASISEYSKRAKTAEDDRDAAASAAERDVRTMQRGAEKSDSQAGKVTLALSNLKDQLEAANLQLAIMKDMQAENQRLKAQVAKLSASDPALLRRLQDERSQLRADVPIHGTSWSRIYGQAVAGRTQESKSSKNCWRSNLRPGPPTDLPGQALVEECTMMPEHDYSMQSC